MTIAVCLPLPLTTGPSCVFSDLADGTAIICKAARRCGRETNCMLQARNDGHPSHSFPSTGQHLPLGHSAYSSSTQAESWVMTTVVIQPECPDSFCLEALPNRTQENVPRGECFTFLKSQPFSNCGRLDLPGSSGDHQTFWSQRDPNSAQACRLTAVWRDVRLNLSTISIFISKMGLRHR